MVPILTGLLITSSKKSGEASSDTAGKVTGPENLAEVRQSLSQQGAVLEATTYSSEDIAAVFASLAEQNSNVQILPGLNMQQLGKLEKKYSFKFPPDVVQFLSAGVPVRLHVEGADTGVPSELPEFYQTATDGWHNWHALSSDQVVVGSAQDTVTKQIAWHATPSEGDEPVPLDCSLIPLYSHRMIASNPHKEGNPVFSMVRQISHISGAPLLWPLSLEGTMLQTSMYPCSVGPAM